MEGWLCPALFKYFTDAPKALYAQIKAHLTTRPIVTVARRNSPRLTRSYFAAKFNKSVSLTLAMRVAVQSAFCF
jgi:hypothetical protein